MFNFSTVWNLKPARAGRRSCRIACCCLAAPLTLLAACNFGPAAVKPPSIDAADAGQAAVEMYDANRDGVISGGELDQAPGLKAAIKRLDTSGDGGASADEVAARIEKWQESEIGLTSFGFKVTLDGAPLVGATVTFEPEAFLGDEVKAATCETNELGGGGASIPKELRPTPSTPGGMQLGMYRVKISKVVGGRELIPMPYNEQTILGQEVALDVPEIAANRVVYALRSKPGPLSPPGRAPSPPSTPPSPPR